MQQPRETYYAALFAKVATLTSAQGALFRTTSRVLKHWSDVPAGDRPYLGMMQVSEIAEQQRGMPPRWTCGVEFYIYVSTELQNDSSIIPSQLINPLLDAVEAALAPDPGPQNAQTLGGLVSHCWISGTVEIYEGLLGNDAVAIIPVNFLPPS